MLGTVATLDFGTTRAEVEVEKESLAVEMKDVESPPPSLHSGKGTAL